MYKKLLISNSSINTFYNNKSTYVDKYVKRSIPTSSLKSKNLSFGSSIHEALNEFNLLDDNEKTLDTIQRLLNKNWIIDGYNSTSEMLDEFMRAKVLLTNYFNDRKDCGKLLLAEEMIFYNVNTNLSVCGKIDKVFINSNGKIELLDYKTGNNVNLMIDVNTDIQLPLYIVLLKHRLNIVPDIVSYYYLSNNTKVSLELTPDIVDICISRLKSIINDMHKEHDI